MLEEREFRSAGELAEAEGVTSSFVNRLLRLTLLAPDIGILEGRQPKGMMLEELTGPVPSDWEDQRVRFRETGSAFAEPSSARSCASERSSSRDDGRAA